MRVLLLSAPGAGKGTQGARLAAHLGVSHLSSGDLLRSEIERGTPLGARVAAVLAAGDLVSDALMEELLYGPVIEAGQRGGFILDGFPRTLHQAEAAHAMAVEHGLAIDVAILLDAPDAVLTARLLGRQRGADDDEQTIAHRLRVYHEQTEPLIAYYRERGVLRPVDATGDVEAVFAAVLAALPARPPRTGAGGAGAA